MRKLRSGKFRACVKYLRQGRFLLLALAGSLGLWIVFAKLVVPRIIKSAYRGESLTFVNSLIHGQGKYSVQMYLDQWDKMAVAILAIFLVLAFTTILTISPSLYRKYAGKATPGTLGAIRMLVCGIVLASAVWEDLASSALLPREMLSHQGLLKLFYYLPGFDSFLSSYSALRVFEALTVLILFLGVIGWQTRIVIPLGAFCYLLLGGIIRQYTWFYHTGLVPLLVLIVLSLTPCGDGWSVDRLRRIAQARPVPAADRALPVYGRSRYLCWLVVALCYVAAGMSKIGNDGLSWFNAAHLKRVMLRDSLNPMEFDWGLSPHLAQAPDVFFTALAVATVVGELSFALVLFFPLARLIVPASMAMMHVGILLVQNVFFPDLIALQLGFYNLTPAREAIGRWLSRRRGHLEVLYDGLCPLCRRTVRLLSGLDLFQRLKFLDFRNLGLAEYNRSRGLKLKLEDLASEMYVVSRSGVNAGFDGYRTMSMALPALWPSVPLLFLPGVPFVGKLVYAYMARNRLTLFTCHAGCPVESPERTSPGQVTPMQKPAARSGYRLAVSAITGLMLMCWALRIEFYPLTAMQMYTGWGPIGPITYYKALARYESGETSRAPLEEAIGALADSRYRRVIAEAFSPTRLARCEKYLTAVASAYNSKVVPGKRLTELEIQKWTWDFVADPSNPSHGVLSERFVFEVPQRPGR